MISSLQRGLTNTSFHQRLKNLAHSSLIRNQTRFSSNGNTAAGSVVYWCGQVVWPNAVSAGSVGVENGKIVTCDPGQSSQEAERLATSSGANFVNLGAETCLMPGLVDVHVHISGLGRNWEGYTTATTAAAAGGITTLIGMPLNSDPATTSPESFSLEQEEAARSQLFVDVGLWGGVIRGNCTPSEVDNLLDSGVLGLKAFLSPLPEAAGYESVSPDQLLEAAQICGKHNKPILVHSELMTEKELLEQTQARFNGVSVQSHQAHVNSRPPEWERAAVELVCKAASFCHMHVVHLSDSGCLDIIRKTKNDPSKKLSVETCPHYLMMDSDSIPDGDTRFKCFPPIRDADNKEKLWKALQDGFIDMVASDHSPCESSLRLRDTGNIKDAWGGLTGLQYLLPATWTEASKRNASLLDTAKWWSYNPCMLAGMADTKGSLEPGKQADFCLWDPNHEGAPDEYSREYHLWKGDTVYASQSDLRGRVLGTWVNGMKVYDGESDEHGDAVGRFLVD